MRRRAAGLGLALGLAASSAAAQSEPLSAIDWLSDLRDRPIAAPAPAEPLTSSGAAAPQVEVLTLNTGSDTIGLVAPSVSGLPSDLWGQSDFDTLEALVLGQKIQTLPALRTLLSTMLVAEAAAPEGARDAFLYLRLDKLLHLGAVEAAFALSEAADPTDPEVFRRYFDASLLLGEEHKACALFAAGDVTIVDPMTSIFCTARGGDWSTAALTLSTARALGDLTPDEVILVTRFLDPELFENETLPVEARSVTPISFRMRASIGAAIPTSGLPLAFAYADLSPNAGWKARLNAAERLARWGALPSGRLIGMYRERRPAASGSVWDRASAVQALESALDQGNARAISRSLSESWSLAKVAGTEVALADFYGHRIEGLTLQRTTLQDALDLGLLSPRYEMFGQFEGVDPLRAAISRGDMPPQPGSQPFERAIALAFSGGPPPERLVELAETGRLGEALLRALALAAEGLDGDPVQLTEALLFLRHVGLEDTARRAALQALTLERR